MIEEFEREIKHSVLEAVTPEAKRTIAEYRNSGFANGDLFFVRDINGTEIVSVSRQGFIAFFEREFPTDIALKKMQYELARLGFSPLTLEEECEVLFRRKGDRHDC
jgi:hypothetical protein